MEYFHTLVLLASKMKLKKSDVLHTLVLHVHANVFIFLEQNIARHGEHLHITRHLVSSMKFQKI